MQPSIIYKQVTPLSKKRLHSVRSITFVGRGCRHGGCVVAALRDVIAVLLVALRPSKQLTQAFLVRRCVVWGTQSGFN